MHDFHYNFIKKKIDAELLFTGTDSLTYEIKSEEFMKKILSTSACLILVTIQKVRSFFDQANEKLIDKMKDVSEGKINDEFVGLNSKMHSMKNTDGKESNTAKGVSLILYYV